MSNTKKNYYSWRRSCACGDTHGGVLAENCWPRKQVNIGWCIFMLPLGHSELICVIFAHPWDAAHLNSAPKIWLLLWKAKKKVNHQVNCAEVFQQRVKKNPFFVLNAICSVCDHRHTAHHSKISKQTAPRSKQLFVFRNKYTCMYKHNQAYLTTFLASLYSVYLFHKNEWKH